MQPTTKALEVYYGMVSFFEKEENQMMPTLQEIADFMGYASPNGALHHIDKLVECEWLARSDKKSRGLRFLQHRVVLLPV